MTITETKNLFTNPESIDSKQAEKLRKEFVLPDEYFTFLEATDGGSLKSGNALFYSISNRLVSGERFFEMNAGQNPKLILIGHYTTQTSEEDFGYLKDRTSPDSSAIFVQLDESDEIQKVAASLEDFLIQLSSNGKEVPT